MVVLIAMSALAGQPGQDKDVREVSVRGLVAAERTVPVGVGFDLRYDAAKHWYLQASGDYRPGYDRNLLLILNTLSARLGGDQYESLNAVDQEYRFAAGGHTANTSRDAGMRGSGGAVVAIFDGHDRHQAMVDAFRIFGSHHSELLAGIEGELGWAVPTGDDVGDPLWVVSVRTAAELPVTAWGAELSELGDSVLAASGVRRRGGLVQPQALTHLRGSLTVQHFRASVDLGMRWVLPASASRSANFVPETQSEPHVAASMGVVF